MLHLRSAICAPNFLLCLCTVKDQQQQQQHHVDYNQSKVTHYKLGCCDAWKLHQQLLSPSPALNMVFNMVAIKILLKSVGWVYIFNVYKLALHSGM